MSLLLPLQLLSINMLLRNGSFNIDEYNFNKFISTGKLVYHSGKKNIYVNGSEYWIPEVKGWLPYNEKFLKSLLDECHKENKEQTLLACSSLLSSTLISDGYVSSRVYSIDKGNQKYIEIVKGKLVEVRISSEDDILKKYIKKKTSLLVGNVLHVPTLEKVINEINSEKNISNVTGDLSTLGSDPSKTILNINVDRISKKWKREILISNQGIVGSGELKTNLILAKEGLFDWKDLFISINEVTSDKNLKIGNYSTSILYQRPIFNDFYLTSSVNLSRRKLIEEKSPLNKIKFNQIQVLTKLSKSLLSTSFFNLNSFLGLNLSKSESFFSGERIGLIKGTGNKGVLQTAYINSGILGTTKNKNYKLTGSLSVNQSISSFTPKSQRENLISDNIYLVKARAIQAGLDLQKFITSKLSFNSRFNSQIALGNLPNDMSFSFGSEEGFSSLPGSISSGDSGWYLINDFTREISNNSQRSIKLSPFFGIGLINKSSPQYEKDYIGSAGVIALLEKKNMNFEIGLVEKFFTENNPGSWNNWLLSSGVYTKLIYKF